MPRHSLLEYVMTEYFKPVADIINFVQVSEDKFIQRYVVCAANRLDDGTIICGARHWDKIMRAVAIKIGWDDCRLAEQGFIDQWQNFMTREEACYVAVTNGQIKKEDLLEEGTLYSEDLY